MAFKDSVIVLFWFFFLWIYFSVTGEAFTALNSGYLAEKLISGHVKATDCISRVGDHRINDVWSYPFISVIN